MFDREKVIKGLECCADRMSCSEKCPYVEFGYSCYDCVSKLARDALALLKEQEEEIENLKQVTQSMIEGICLLKEQEPVEPIPPTDESDLWRCGNCNHQLFRCTHQRYCEMCGREVKWERKSAIARSANVTSVEHGATITFRRTITRLE